MSLYKRDGIWWCSLSVRGKRVRKSTGVVVKGEGAKAPAEARLFEGRLLQEVEKRGADSLRKAPRLGEFLPEFRGWLKLAGDRGELAVNSVRTYKDGLKTLEATELLGERLDHLTADGVLKELARVGATWSTTNSAVRALRRGLNKAVEWKRLGASGMPKLRLLGDKRRTMLIQPEQEVVLLDASPQPLRDVLMCVLDMGLRPDEVFRMRWEDVQWTERIVDVREGKTDAATRRVPMTERVQAALLARFGKVAGVAGWVFTSKRSKSGHLTTVAKQWRKMREGLKLPKELVLYSARHSFGTHILNQTGNTAVTMKVMGHKDVRTTMRYQHPDMDMVREAVERRVAKATATVVVASQPVTFADTVTLEPGKIVEVSAN